MQNDGTFNWTGGSINLGNNPFGTTVGGANIVNALGATFNDQVAGSITNNTGTNVFNNAGTFETTFASGATTIGVTFNNTGTVNAQGGTLDFTGALTNTGTLNANGGNILVTAAETNAGNATISGTSQIQYNAASNEHVTFSSGATGELVLLNSSVFNGDVTGFTGTGTGAPATSDKLDLRDINFASAQFAKGYLNNVLTVTDGSHTAHINMVGSYTLANFHFATDNNGGTLVTDPPTLPDQSSGSTITIADGVTKEIAGNSSQDIAFFSNTGTLRLDTSTLFVGQITGFAGANSIDLSDIAFGAGSTIGYAPDSGNMGGTLSIGDGAHMANIALLGNYMASSFVASSDGHGGTLITDPPPVAQLNLIQPHV
jgi:hypothetical protein